MMTIAVAALFATSAFAQNPDAFKQIKKAKTAEEVKSLISANESSMSSTENAQAYNKLVDLTMTSVNAAQTAIQTNQVKEQMKQEPTEQVDMKAMYNDLYTAYDAVLKCDKYDSQPNEKGKVALKFRKANADRLYSLRPYLINAGQDAQSAEDNKSALNFFSMYVNTAASDVFKEKIEADAKTSPEGVGDPYLSEVARVAAVASYNAGDIDAAQSYLNVVMKDPAKVKDAINLKLYFIDKSAKNHEDSVRCLEQIKEVYAQYPADNDVFARLAQWYSNMGQKDNQLELINQKLQSDPENFTAWAMKGQSEMNAQKYDDAVTSLKKSLDCKVDDQAQKALVNTFIGYCLTQKAPQMEKFEDQVAVLKDAIPYLEEAKKLDPNRERSNWAYPLYNCYYYVKGEKDAQTVELKELLGL